MDIIEICSDVIPFIFFIFMVKECTIAADDLSNRLYTLDDFRRRITTGEKNTTGGRYL